MLNFQSINVGTRNEFRMHLPIEKTFFFFLDEKDKHKKKLAHRCNTAIRHSRQKKK